MRRFTVGCAVFAGVLACQTAVSTSASGIVRELRRMNGYVVVSSDTVSRVSEEGGSKYVRLLSGATFKIDDLILGPLVMSDVIVFAKPVSAELKRQFSSLPPEYLYLSL